TPDRNLLDLAFHTEDPKQGGAELLQRAVGLKNKQVSSQQTLKKLLTPRQNGKDFRGWEGNVQKETNSCVRQPLTKHLRKQYQMIIVHPDEVIRLITLHDCLGTNPICLNVGLPGLRLHSQLGRNRMKHLPPRLVAAAPVASSCHILW